MPRTAARACRTRCRDTICWASTATGASLDEVELYTGGQPEEAPPTDLTTAHTPRSWWSGFDVVLGHDWHMIVGAAGGCRYGTAGPVIAGGADIG